MSHVCFAFLAKARDGFVPNGTRGVETAANGGPGELSGRTNAFAASRLPHHVAKSGFEVEFALLAEAALRPGPWFYLVRPYSVPELDAEFTAAMSAAGPALAAGEGYVLIDYAHEGYSEWMFDRVYSALRNVPLPPKQIILLSGDLNVEDNHRAYVSRHAITSHVRVHSLNYFRNEVADYLSRSEHVPFRIHGQKHDRRRLFLNFNRRNRLHRILATVLLNNHGLLDKGLVSLPAEFDGRSNEMAYEDEARRFGLSNQRLQQLREDYRLLKPKLPLQIDVADMTANHAHTHPVWPYLETWFSVVSESLFFETSQNEVFISEKTWKPMMNFHPFLVIGNAGTLQALHAAGFRTFHPHIDETYDREPDHEKRLELVLKEIQRLARVPRALRHDWFMQMADALEHNFQRLSAKEYDSSFSFWQTYLKPSR